MTTPITDKQGTPLTDAAIVYSVDAVDDTPYVDVDFARKLERENQKLREALNELQTAGIKADFWMADHENSELHKRGGSQNRKDLVQALAAASAALGGGDNL
jgi:hypothetical protein